jgi:AcrR family transcriptional regulator
MTSEAPAVRRVPRGRERREQLVRVAEEVFLVHGFADSTMQTIASRAGASKETLYRHFASKEALFAEVVGRRAAQISGPESALSSKAPPRRVLFELGCGLLRLMTQGEVVPLLRLVIAESARTPELGAILYAKGPGATCDRLTDYLRAATGARRQAVPRRGDHQLSRAGIDRPTKNARRGDGNSRPRARRGRDVPGLLRASKGENPTLDASDMDRRERSPLERF